MGRDHCEVLGIYGRIILKLILKETGWENGRVWSDSSVSG
jgi:hypothetical protein